MHATAGRSRSRGFTLTELMVAMSIFGMVLGAILLSQIAGMRLVDKTQRGLDSRGQVLRTIDNLVNEVRSAGIVRVGLWTNSAFLARGPRETQQGNAVRLYPAGFTNSFVQYHLETSDRTLRRWESGSEPNLLLRGVTNSLVFRGESFQGGLVTNALNNFALRVSLHFDSAVNPLEAYDTRITRRTLE